MQVYALDTINTDKEEVFVTYITTYLPFKIRQEKLKSSYNFDCNCVRCDIKNRDKDDEMICKADKLDEQLVELLKTNGSDVKIQNILFETLKISEALDGKYSPNN